jgi:proteasome lid subunit RPN8/RPN11
MDLRDVFIEKRSFRTLVASAIEVYNRETNGVLLGRKATMNIDGVKKKVVSIKDVYPIQTDKRSPSQVTHGNISAFNRFLRAMESLKTEIIGGFHSHPHPYESVRLSRGDVEFIGDEVKVMGKIGQERVKDGWLEILISIKRKDYKRSGEEEWYICDYVKKVRCLVRTKKKEGYDITISAYWVYPKKNDGNDTVYGIKEVAVYVPWILD